MIASLSVSQSRSALENVELVPANARMRQGVVTNVFGRERRLGKRLNVADSFTRGEAEREAINYTIQSVSGAITNRTIALVHAHIQKLRDTGQLSPTDVFLVNTVHDSVMYEVKDHLVDWFVEVLRTIGERPIPELNNNTFKMDAGVGRNWTQAELAALGS